MADKRSKLIARSKETIRAPMPSRLEADRTKPKGYRVIGISLYTPEADWLDQATAALQRAGNAKANRSLVVREAILRLQQQVDTKDATGLLKDFTARQASRSKHATS